MICPFCEITKPDDVYVTSGFHFFCCTECHSLFRSDAGVALDHHYDAEYYGDSPKEKFWLKPVVWLLNAERGSRAKFISKRISKSSSVIDIGCGNGALLNRIHQLSGAKVTGVEMDNVAAQRARDRGCIEVFSDSFEKAPLAEGSFDAVIMIHSFEHIPQPVPTLTNAVALLKPGGIFYIAIPNINSIQYAVFRKHWLHLDPEFHLHFISRRELIKLASEAGLKFIKTKHFNPVQNIPGFILSAMNLVTGRRDVLFNMLRNKKKLRNPLNILVFIFLMLFAAFLLPFAIIEECISCLAGRGATVDYVFEKGI
ncbi:MAG: hypothetical protein A2W93_05615 [Bacteroidetes bacterium GWF2_43_63]|nr:MAG: hypothetical protein A2W94_07445 [Bacteroidetes bacterium GWE2_42_42]OFY55493.1 MAG: hypothetical protein A2W93_05615 [Bacteroidetes bacterium GWF2_43_63]HBG69970.1 hypothetical protein [Bacteroidales bacterium]HCB62603.1 hypothetical protein [Bacteroidales bacterium]HCY23723.1 hypothetical protein [Bacteroidales bacterium]